MAIRMEDEDERISNLVKLFFHEFSKKGAGSLIYFFSLISSLTLVPYLDLYGTMEDLHVDAHTGNNPIYNLLPDILSKLSQQNLKKDSFCNIMQFLIGFIKKDKQMESLVEKLCSRFTGSGDVTQWEYISYCLSQLAFTEKGLKKLMDSFKIYEHSLSNEYVMEHFRVIVSKSKKFAKPELKSCIEEFEEKLNKFHLENKELEHVARNAQSHQKKVVRKRVGYSLNNNAAEDVAECDEEGEVTDESLDGARTTTHSPGQATNPMPADSEEHSDLLNVETTQDSGYLEVKSPHIISRGATTSTVKRTIKTNVKAKASVSSKSNIRSRKKVVYD